MISRTPVSERRRRRSSGNTIVESVFTLLPTFALVFAFIDFGMMLYRWSTLQNAVREGCRYAITFQRQNGANGQPMGQVASIKNVVERYSMRLVRANSNPQRIFVKFYTQSNPDVEVTTGGNVPGNIVEVSVQNLSFAWMAPLSGSYGGRIPFFRNRAPLMFRVFSSDIMGGMPVGVSSVPL